MLRGIHSSPREGFKAGGAGDEESGKGVNTHPETIVLERICEVFKFFSDAEITP